MTPCCSIKGWNWLDHIFPCHVEICDPVSSFYIRYGCCVNQMTSMSSPFIKQEQADQAYDQEDYQQLLVPSSKARSYQQLLVPSSVALRSQQLLVTSSDGLQPFIIAMASTQQLLATSYLFLVVVPAATSSFLLLLSSSAMFVAFPSKLLTRFESRSQVSLGLGFDSLSYGTVLCHGRRPNIRGDEW